MVSAKLSCWEMITMVSSFIRTLLLWGDPGTGKTYAAMDTLGQDAMQVTLNEDMSAQELFGHYMPVGSEFQWHDGPFIEAMRQGKGLIINELQRASGAVKDALLGLLDSEGSASYSLPSGETVKPKPGFRVIATSNSNPSELDAALVDRFQVIVHIPTPAPGVIAMLDNWQRGLGQLVENSYTGDSPVSPRKAIAYKTLVQRGVPSDVALDAVFGERANDVRMALAATCK